MWGFIPTGKFGQPGEYEQWLKEDLETASTQRDIRPWIIVVGHRPISVLDDQVDPFRTPLTQNIIELIGTHADVYVSGHVHYYARSLPKENSIFQAKLISVGGAGCDEWDSRRLTTTISGETDMFDYFGYGDEQTYGLLKFDKKRPEEIVIEILKSSDGDIVDQVIVGKRAMINVNSISDPVIKIVTE